MSATRLNRIMRFVSHGVLGLLVACGARTDLGERGHDAEPPVYCSLKCGLVDAAAPSATACALGQICGETGGAYGFECCDPEHCWQGKPLNGECH